MEIDPKDIVNIRIDRRRKFPMTILFKALGYSTEDILAYFYTTERYIVKGKRIYKEFNADLLKGQRASRGVKNPETGDTIVMKGRVFTKSAISQLKSAKVDKIPVGIEDILDKVFASTIWIPKATSLL